jgi:uncharacterized protein
MNTPFFSFLSVFCITCCFAFNTWAQSEGQVNTENALMWKVTGKELTKPSYLYGTIHMICPNDMVMTETIKSTFSQTEQVYLEMDMDDLGVMMKMMSPKTMNMEKGKSLKKLLSVSDYAKVEKFFADSLDTNLKKYDNTKPFFTMSTLYPKMLPCEKPAAYEVEFLMMARKEKKEILGLEPFEAQLEAVNFLSVKEQAEALVKFVDEYSKGKGEFAELVEAYKKENLSIFAELMKEQDAEMEGFTDNFLKKRNTCWIPVIEKASTTKSTFFAFGAAHLAGDFGIVNLLRQAGYKVEPVKL